MREKILVIGSSGQIGSELTEKLQEIHGISNVIAADIKRTSSFTGIFAELDVLDEKKLNEIISSHGITQVYLLAAFLSATSEKNPHRAWNLNVNGLLNVLEAGKEKKVKKIFWPSSIAVFGPASPKENVPQDVALDPVTVYGISKLAGERWCEYYFLKYGVDVRSLRYPGLVSHKSPPGGGTTDYAVDIFYHAIENKKYECFLRGDTFLPMMYMPDAIRASLEVMNAAAEAVQIRSSYNISAMSFSPRQIANELKTVFPEFEINYNPDFRQKIADSWPKSIDDSMARKHWKWLHRFDLGMMVKDMVENIQNKTLKNM